jgi:hypothetical protein
LKQEPAGHARAWRKHWTVPDRDNYETWEAPAISHISQRGAGAVWSPEVASQDPGLTLKGAVTRVGPRVVMPNTLRGWMKGAAIDAGLRPGATTVRACTVHELEGEIKELNSQRGSLGGPDGSSRGSVARRCRG